MIYHLRCGQSRILLCQTEPALVIHLKFPKFACGRAGLGEKKLAARGRLETGGGREKRHRQGSAALWSLPGVKRRGGTWRCSAVL